MKLLTFSNNSNYISIIIISITENKLCIVQCTSVIVQPTPTFVQLTPTLSYPPHVNLQIHKCSMKTKVSRTFKF